jgi:DNA-binding HxlR family transcriptional regulator
MMEIPSEEPLCLSLARRALEILGGKWSFLVLAHLYRGPQRFNALRRALDPISTKALTDTLRHLERNAVIGRQVFPTVPVTVEYSLTEKGKDFHTVLAQMYAWAQKWGTQEEQSASNHHGFSEIQH